MATSKGKEPTKMCRGYGSSFFDCIGTKRQSDFFVSWSRFSDGTVGLCKNCLQKLWDYWMEETKSEKMALYYTLAQIDTPFIKEVYEELITKKGKVTLSLYLTELHKKGADKNLYENFACTNVMDITTFGSKIATLEEQKEKRRELEKRWGIQDTEEDYDFLETTFDRYTDGIEFVNPQQEDLYRDLTRDRLLLRKINDGRYGGEESIDKVQNRIAKTMSTLKVDQFEQKKKKTDIERILERQIWEIENTEPAEVVDKNEYADFLDIKKSWGQDILRCVKNLLVNSKEYPNITRDSDKY